MQAGDHMSFMAAYNKLLNSPEAKKPGWVHPMRPGELKYMGEAPYDSSKMYEKFFEKNKVSVNCFNHISKARCQANGRLSIQRFANTFNLKTYLKSDGELYYPYCTHPFVQPLLYGWFPVNMIPFCPKLEWAG